MVIPVDWGAYYPYKLYKSKGFFDKSYSFANGMIGVGVLTNPYVYIQDTCVT